MSDLSIATFAGGCFWCTEGAFQQLQGVHSVQSGYAGGHTENPTYEAVCTGTTGYAEVVQLEFDEAKISYRELLEVLFAIHDPTQLNRQGNDIGSQYRSAIFFHTEEQRNTAEAFIAEVTADEIFDGPVVTEVTAVHNWYPAEDHHEDYFNRNSEQPYCAAVVAPKLARFRQTFANKLKA